MPNFEFDEMQQMVTDGSIGAISLDTSIFDQFACNLDSPSLEALEQFVGSSVQVILTDVVLGGGGDMTKRSCRRFRLGECRSDGENAGERRKNGGFHGCISWVLLAGAPEAGSRGDPAGIEGATVEGAFTGNAVSAGRTGVSPPRAAPDINPFRVGELYSRDDIAETIGLPLSKRGGNWDTGYAKPFDSFFLFVNVGAKGRTGHDYPNRWEGNDLLWSARNGTRLGQGEITALLGGAHPVHIFWRAKDRARFTYAGLGAPIDVEDTTPVRVRCSPIQ